MSNPEIAQIPGRHRTGGSVTITNSIFWGNQSQSGTDTNLFDDSSEVKTAPSYSMNEEGCPSSANISCGDSIFDTLPGFTNAENDDFHFTNGSAAIDAGDNTDIASDALDLDELARITGGDGDSDAVVDSGVYEYNP